MNFADAITGSVFVMACWIPLAVWLDFRLYKKGKGKHLLLPKGFRFRSDKEAIRAIAEVNCREMWFMMLGTIFAYMTWLLLA